MHSKTEVETLRASIRELEARLLVVNMMLKRSSGGRSSGSRYNTERDDDNNDDDNDGDGDEAGKKLDTSDNGGDSRSSPNRDNKQGSRHIDSDYGSGSSSSSSYQHDSDNSTNSSTTSAINNTSTTSPTSPTSPAATATTNNNNNTSSSNVFNIVINENFNINNDNNNNDNAAVIPSAVNLASKSYEFVTATEYEEHIRKLQTILGKDVCDDRCYRCER